MVKINPGSNDLADNDTRTANLSNMNLPEPILRSDGKVECPICGKDFHSRERYAGHATIDHKEFANPSAYGEEPLKKVPPEAAAMEETTEEPAEEDTVAKTELTSCSESECTAP